MDHPQPLQPTPDRRQSHRADEDRRRADRHHAVRLMAKLIEPAGESLCLLRDISPFGMRAAMHADLARGDQVQIELPDGELADAAVAWRKDRLAGFAFAAPIEPRRQMCRGTDSRPRRAPRVRIDAPAMLRRDDKRTPAQIIDLSLGGAKLAVEGTLRVGDLVLVDFEGLALKAGSIRWVGDTGVGMKFHAPMAFEQINDWLFALRTGAFSVSDVG